MLIDDDLIWPVATYTLISYVCRPYGIQQLS